MSNPRGFMRDVKPGRTSKQFGEGAPLSGRTMNDGYYQEGARTNYNSREFQTGIFTNQLSKAVRKREEKDIPLELTEIVDYPNLKARNNKKQFEYSKQSREESLHNYQQGFEIAGYDDRQLREEIRAEMEILRSQIRKQTEFVLSDKVKRMMNDHSASVRDSIGDLVMQTNNAFKKKEESLYLLKVETFNLKEELGRFYKTYQAFSQQSEQKFENIYVQMSNLGVKKSKSPGQYNVDLKNSFQGMNSSLSMNLNAGSESHSSKLVNQVIFQLDSQKKELSETKELIQQLTEKLNSNLILSQKQNISDKLAEQKLALSRDQVSHMMRDALIDDRRRQYRLQQKMQQFDQKIKDVQTIIFNQESNIKGINDEFANTINNQVNIRLKKIEVRLIDLSEKIDPNAIVAEVKKEVSTAINTKLSETRLLHIRNCNQAEIGKLSVLTGHNEDKISFKETYLLDQDNFLLDSQGNYLVEEIGTQKQRIKIDSNMIYLLGLKGIEIQGSA